MGLKLSVNDVGLRGLRASRSRLGRVVLETAANVQAHAQVAITSGPKTGRVYQRGEHQVQFATKGGGRASFTAHKGKAASEHQASAPGEAPANEFGNLAGSMSHRMTGETSAEVSVNAEQAAALEFGREDGSIESRPYLTPAAEQAREGFGAAITLELRRAAEGN